MNIQTISDTNNSAQLYRIGAVSKLTGIACETLRVWESRYGTVKPVREGKGGRLYALSDISRLVKIKALVDQGHAIGTLAMLNEDQLEERLSSISLGISKHTRLSTRHICIVGQALSVRIDYADVPPFIQLAASYESLSGYMSAAMKSDGVIIEIPVLNNAVVEQLSEMDRVGQSGPTIVIYSFAQKGTIKQLIRQGLYLLKAPVNLDHLWQLFVHEHTAMSGNSPDDITLENLALERIPQRMFNSEQLAWCSNAPSNLMCECPHHMAQIIEMLVAFENYSAQCENQTAADAVIHNYLHVMTAKSRSIMEMALKKLMDVEKIDLKQQLARDSG